MAWAPLGTPVYTSGFYFWGGSVDAFLLRNPGWATAGPSVNIGPVPGRFSGGDFTVNTAAPGEVIQGVVMGWDGQDMGMGISDIFTVKTGDPTLTPPGTPGSIISSTLTPFNGHLTFMPEPSSFALASLGAAMLAILRHRRRTW
jgi:hypothetical protein